MYVCEGLVRVAVRSTLASPNGIAHFCQDKCLHSSDMWVCVQGSFAQNQMTLDSPNVVLEGLIAIRGSVPNLGRMPNQPHTSCKMGLYITQKGGIGLASKSKSSVWKGQYMILETTLSQDCIAKFSPLCILISGCSYNVPYVHAWLCS